MITIPGQLAIKTIHSRNGDFSVARLKTAIGEFYVKENELEQYDQGKYDGEFIIQRFRLWTYVTNGKAVTEMRADVSSMVLSTIDWLSKDEADKLSPQDVDPVEEETLAIPVHLAKDPVSEVAPIPQETATAATSSENLIEVTATQPIQTEEAVDSELFGCLFPLTQVVKLDATVNRRVFRDQRVRLKELGYRFAPITQDWHLNAA